MDTASNNNENEQVPVSLEIAQQVRAALSDLLGKALVPPALEGLPIELWLQRIVPIAVAAELLGGLTPETVLKKYRSELIQLDGRKYGMRLGRALRLDANNKESRRKKAKLHQKKPGPSRS